MGTHPGAKLVSLPYPGPVRSDVLAFSATRGSITFVLFAPVRLKMFSRAAET